MHLCMYICNKSNETCKCSNEQCREMSQGQMRGILYEVSVGAAFEASYVKLSIDELISTMTYSKPCYHS